jgi:hypothetical protein
MPRERRWMLFAFVASVLLAAAVWRWSGALPTGGIATPRPTVERTAVLADRGSSSEAASTAPRDAGSFRPPTGTVHDRAVRDDIRARILAAWLSSLPQVDSGFDAGLALQLPMPVLDGGTVDPAYLRERITEDFVPMARACYEQLLGRRPDASGRALTEFVILGDDRLGGVVDEVSVQPGDGGLADEGFATCLRESMYTVAFRPPPGRGSLRVRYPFTFRPDGSDAGR